MRSNRRCGECGACCDVLAVPGLKPENSRCPHMASCGTNRCRIHGDPQKPPVCSTYLCMWLQGAFTSSDRPDRLGVFFDAHEQDGHYVVVAREIVAGNADKPRAAELIRLTAAHSVVIVVPPNDGKRRIVCSNPGLVAKLRGKLASLGVSP